MCPVELKGETLHEGEQEISRVVAPDGVTAAIKTPFGFAFATIQSREISLGNDVSKIVYELTTNFPGEKEHTVADKVKPTDIDKIDWSNPTFLFVSERELVHKKTYAVNGDTVRIIAKHIPEKID